MSRFTIVVLLFFALAAVSLGSYFLVLPRVEEIQLEESNRGLETTGRVLQEMDVADEGRLLRKMMGLSSRSDLHALLKERPADAASLEKWLVKLRAEIAGLAAAAREVATVQDMFILDPAGAGLVRNVDMHWTGKPPSTQEDVLQAVKSSIKGKPEVLLFVEEDQLFRAVSVPIHASGRLYGVLLAVFPVDDRLAKDRSLELMPNVDFAYLTATAIAARSPLADSERLVVEEFLDRDPSFKERLISGEKVESQMIGSGGRRLQILGLPVIAQGGKGACGLLVLRPVGKLKQPLEELAAYLFAGTGLLFLVFLVVTVLFGGRLDRALKGLEQDLLTMVNEGRVRKIDAKGPAIVRSIAELANQLPELGTVDEGEERIPDATAEKGSEEELEEPEKADSAEDKSEEVEASQEAAEETNAAQDEPLAEEASADEELAQDGDEGSDQNRAAAEDQGETDGDQNEATGQDEETKYYRGVFDNFLKAKRELGDKPPRVAFGRFMAKLQKQAAAIRAKHGCKNVRFQVTVKAGKVSLVPKIVR